GAPVMRRSLGSPHRRAAMRDDRDLLRAEERARRDARLEDPAGDAERAAEPLGPADPLGDLDGERVYPAPPRELDPVAAAEDALLRDRADAGWERAGELDTLPARLGGAEGLGVMRVVRSSDGVAVSVPGTWRPPAGEPLAERFAVGSVVRYEGPLHLGDGSVRDVAEDVRVTSAGRYMTEDGEEYDIVNFEAVANPRAWRL